MYELDDVRGNDTLFTMYELQYLFLIYHKMREEAKKKIYHIYKGTFD